MFDSNFKLIYTLELRTRRASFKYGKKPLWYSSAVALARAIPGARETSEGAYTQRERERERNSCGPCGTRPARVSGGRVIQLCAYPKKVLIPIPRLLFFFTQREKSLYLLGPKQSCPAVIRGRPFSPRPRLFSIDTIYTFFSLPSRQLSRPR